MPVLNTDFQLYSIDSDCETITIPKFVTTIPDNVFRSFVKLKTVIIPDGIKTIGRFAFKNCKSLNCVVLPDSVTHIGVGAFAYCDCLDDIRLSESITEIDDCAFVGCAFNNITLPKNLKSLGALVFRRCRNLTSVILPDGIKHIAAEQDLFQDCDSLKQISVCADCVVERGSIPDSCRVVYRQL